jgi:hypothetical protein
VSGAAFMLADPLCWVGLACEGYAFTAQSVLADAITSDLLRGSRACRLVLDPELGGGVHHGPGA